MNHFKAGKDGMTPYERVTKRKWRRPLVEFGEQVLANMVLRRQQQGKRKKQKRKMASRCVEVTWVGQIARRGDHIVIKHNVDAFKCRTIKRVPVEHQWSAERITQARGTPRDPAPSMKNSHQRESRLADDEAAETRGPRRPKLEKCVIQML